MVDRAFLEWDKASMSKQLQQLDKRLRTASREACVAVRLVPLKAMALLLVLVIIPTTSGVALIA